MLCSVCCNRWKRFIGKFNFVSVFFYVCIQPSSGVVYRYVMKLEFYTAQNFLLGSMKGITEIIPLIIQIQGSDV